MRFIIIQVVQPYSSTDTASLKEISFNFTWEIRFPYDR